MHLHLVIEPRVKCVLLHCSEFFTTLPLSIPEHLRTSERPGIYNHYKFTTFAIILHHGDISPACNAYDSSPCLVLVNEGNWDTGGMFSKVVKTDDALLNC